MPAISPPATATDGAPRWNSTSATSRKPLAPRRLCTASTSRSPSGELLALLGPVRLGQDDPVALRRRSRNSLGRPDPVRWRGRQLQKRAGTAYRLRVPALCPVQASDHRRQHFLRPEGAAAPDAANGGGHPGQGRGTAGADPVAGLRRAAIRASCPAVSAKGWRSLGRSPSSRACCCSMNRSAPWTPRCARNCACG